MTDQQTQYSRRNLNRKSKMYLINRSLVNHVSLKVVLGKRTKGHTTDTLNYRESSLLKRKVKQFSFSVALYFI